MAQVLKDSVRKQIANAAERLFAKVGYKKATVVMIANEASVATGNIYKYYANKGELFNSIITNEFAEDFKLLTRNRVEVLNDPSKSESVRSIESGEAGRFLRFCIENRLKIIIVLSKAEGSKYESFAEEYIRSMTEQTMGTLPIAYPNLKNTKVFRFTFNRMLLDTVRGLVSILENYEDEEQIVEAFVIGWAYHYAGINAVIEWCSRAGDN